jgi:hypothetical protein
MGALLISICLIKNYPKITQKVEEIKQTIFFGVIIKTVQTGYLPMAVASGLGKGICYDCSVSETFTANFGQIIYLNLVVAGTIYFVNLVDVKEFL